ncbi:Major facilitator superfamily transporter [Trichuris trichiura]|uniref:Major facilitator superfamily transporter n=1 Tax=Trichuris trichiura TaxID=36087 RepID=A0A077ZKG3_TRITR|nr:Major facilitator superfamily transporter [Trichuris trichiura]
MGFSGRKKVIVFLITGALTLAAMVHSLLTRTLGIAMVCMTNGTSNNTTSSSCDTNVQRSFNWNYFVQGNVIAMHDWGELLFLPFTGFLISISNPMLTLLAATGLSVVSTTLFPFGVLAYDYKGAMVSRFFLGISHAFTSPSVDAVVNHWLPNAMRSTLYSLITSGSQVAVLIGNPMIAAFCHGCFMGGWPAAFYVPSIVALIWLAMCSVLYIWKMREKNSRGADSVDREAKISSGLWRPIREAVRSVGKEVGTNRAVWALLPCSMAATWTNRFFTFYIPNFYRDVLHLPLMTNAAFSSLPFLVQIVGKLLFSSASDLMLSRHWLSRNVSSKMFNSISFLGSGFCLVLSGFVSKTSPHAVIALLTTGLAVYSSSAPGYQLSIVSMNKKWTGLISSMCTCAAMVGAIVLPYMVAAVVRVGTEGEWRSMFFSIYLNFTHLFESINSNIILIFLVLSRFINTTILTDDSEVYIDMYIRKSNEFHRQSGLSWSSSSL